MLLMAGSFAAALKTLSAPATVGGIASFGSVVNVAAVARWTIPDIPSDD